MNTVFGFLVKSFNDVNSIIFKFLGTIINAIILQVITKPNINMQR